MSRRIQDEFTPLAVSRQRKLQLRRKRDHLCVACGQPLKTYANRCDPCSEKLRSFHGFKAWRPGSKGRMPNSLKLSHCRITAVG